MKWINFLKNTNYHSNQNSPTAIKETELLTFQKAKYQALQIHCEFHQTLKEETVPTLYNLSQKTKAEWIFLTHSMKPGLL